MYMCHRQYHGDVTHLPHAQQGMTVVRFTGRHSHNWPRPVELGTWVNWWLGEEPDEELVLMIGMCRP